MFKIQSDSPSDSRPLLTVIDHPSSTNAPPMPIELRKQISIFVPVSDWRTIRLEAARRRIPITELCRQWMRPHVRQLRHQHDSPPESVDEN